MLSKGATWWGRGRFRPGPAVLVLAILGAALAFAPGVAATHGARAADAPTFNVMYHPDGRITVALNDGTLVGGPRSPGNVIAPGTYNIVFNHDAKVLHQFHVFGPGADVTVSPADGSDGMCGGSAYLYAVYKVTLLPNTIYAWQDDYQPAAIHQFFSTSGPATSVGTAGTTGGSTSGGGTSGTPSTKIITGSGFIGTDKKKTPAAPLRFRGTLAGSVGATGDTKLMQNGRTVGTLKAGKYRIVVDDRGWKSGFMLQQLRKAPLVLSNVPFLGKRSVTVELRVGQWMYYATGRKKTYFVVVA